MAMIDTSRAEIEFGLEKAKIYQAAGLQGEARASLESVQIAAQSEGERHLFDKAGALAV